MERRSLFKMIFGNNKAPNYQQLQLLNGISPIWTSFNGNLYDNTQVRSCIDAIARNGAKLNPKHIRYGVNGYEEVYGRVKDLISRKPNEIMNAYQFYYKVISELYLNNNAFVFIQRDASGLPIGLYPISAGNYKLLEHNGNVYLQFIFSSGNTYTASIKDSVIHLKRFYCENDVLGGTNNPIIKTMSFKHILDEGLINAIKTTQSIKGILKTTKAMLKPEDIKATRDAFVKDFMGANSTIAGLDATTDFKEVNINPTTATDSQIKLINDEIKNYFGISDSIIQSKYTEDEWNAFYESVIEPLALQLSMEMTNKLFTFGERWHGNEIVFEANRLQYASNTTKISLLKEAGALGLLTINECREVLNLAPVKDGDTRVQSLNYVDKVNDDRGNENE